MSKKSKYIYVDEKEGVDIDPKIAIWIIGLVALVGIYSFIIRPSVVWIKQNIILFGIIIIFLIILVILSIFFYYKRKKGFEKSQKEKGLVKFIDRNKNLKWVKLKDLEKLKKIDKEEAEKEKLFNRIVDEIEEFEPARRELRDEYAYHLSLHSWLKKTFPEAEIEKRKKYSIPDIVIGDVAIEVKGPTYPNDLTNIAHKCMEYPEQFEGGLIIVLFNVYIKKERYEDWLINIKKQYPRVKIIRK